MATELAKAYVQIVPSAEGIKGKLSEALGGEANDAGKKGGERAGHSFGATIKKIIIAAGIGKVIKDAITEGANYEQLVGGVETLFKDSAGVVEKYAANAYKTAGMSANQYMETVTSFSASLLQSLGGDTEAAAKISDMAITDMADNANKMGSSVESIQNAYQGFAKQNYTMLDNLKLGYGGTQSEMARLLQDAEKISGIKYNIKNLDDVYSAIHVIQTEMGITGTTAAEAGSTVQGSLASMKSAWMNLLTGIASGGSIYDQVTGLVESVKTFAKNIIPMVGNIISGLVPSLARLAVELVPALLDQLIPAFVDVFTTLGKQADTFIRPLIYAITKGITTLLKAAPELLTAGLSMLEGIAQGILDSLPVLLEALPGVINTIVSFISTELPNLVSTIVTFITEATPQIMQGALQLFRGFVDAIPQIVAAITESLPQIFTTIIAALQEAIPSILEVLPELFQSALDAIFGCLPMLTDCIVQIVGMLAEALPDIIMAIVDILPDLIVSIVTGLIQQIPTLISCVVQIVVAIVKALPQIFLAIGQALVKLVIELAGKVKNLWTEFKKAAGEWISKIWSGIQEKWGTLIQNIVNFFRQIPQKIGDTLRNIGDVGKNLVKGLWNGITNVTSWVLDKIRGFGRSILNGIKKIFGIGSPSKEMAYFGEMLDAGLAQGIEGNTRPISNAIDDITAMTTKGFSSDLGVSSSMDVNHTSAGMAQLVQLVAALSDKIDKLQVYLDGDLLVGGISDRMDTALGVAGTYKARGLA